VGFDDRDKYSVAKKNPSLFFSMHKLPMIIDEVQKVPDIINQIKLIVDNNPTTKGQFILTGFIDIIKSANINESLVGRFVGHKLYPLSANELYSNNDNWLDILFQPEFYTNFENFKPKDTSTILNRLLIGSFPELQSIDAKKLMLSHDTIDNYIFLLHSTFLTESLAPIEAKMAKQVKIMK